MRWPTRWSSATVHTPLPGNLARTPPGTGTETVQAFFNGEQLPCTTLGFGDTLNFTVTNSGGTKTITLTLIGQAAVDEHGLDGRSERDGVKVRAQSDAAILGPLDAREQVARVRPRGGTGAVLVDVDADPAQLGLHPVRARPLATRGAVDPAEGRERLV